jgi:hypothetical protein
VALEICHRTGLSLEKGGGVEIWISPGNWVSGIGHGPYGISLWKHIRKGWEKFRGYIKFEVGNGNCIRFWEDHWCGDRPLGEMFPMVYRVVRQKDVLVAEYLSWHNGAPQWDLHLNRNLHDWKWHLSRLLWVSCTRNGFIEIKLIGCVGLQLVMVVLRSKILLQDFVK